MCYWVLVKTNVCLWDIRTLWPELLIITGFCQTHHALGAGEPRGVHCNTEMIDLGSSTSKDRGHKKGTWASSSMSFSSGHRGGWLLWQCQREILPMSKFLGNAPKGHLLCIERKVRIYKNSWADGSVGWSGFWKEKKWQIEEKKDPGEWTCMH